MLYYIIHKELLYVIVCYRHEITIETLIQNNTPSSALLNVTLLSNHAMCYLNTVQF
jgi:hypothetical protein